MELTSESIKKRAPDNLLSALSDEGDITQLIQDGISIVESLIPLKNEGIKKEAVINYVFYNLWLGIGEVESAAPYNSTYKKLTGLNDYSESISVKSEDRTFTSENLDEWGF